MEFNLTKVVCVIHGEIGLGHLDGNLHIGAYMAHARTAPIWGAQY